MAEGSICGDKRESQRPRSIILASMICFIAFFLIIICLVQSDEAVAEIGDSDLFDRPLPENFNNYTFDYRSPEESVVIITIDGLSYWIEYDECGRPFAQLVGVGIVSEGQVVTVPEYIDYQGKQCLVISVGICFQPFKILDYSVKEYMFHVGLTANLQSQDPLNYPRMGVGELVEPVHYSIVFKGCVRIQDYAFSEFDVFRSPRLTAGCFYTKSGITSVTFEKGVSSIGKWAFAYSSLENITLPKEIKYVGEYAFYYTKNLNDVSWDTDVDIPDYLFYQSSLSSIRINGGPTRVGSYAFSSTNIVTISIPDSVLQLGDNCFHICEMLEFASIGNGVTIIPAGCFNRCVALRDIYIAGTIKEVGSVAFYNGPSLNSFKFTGLEKVGAQAFDGVFNGSDQIFLDLSKVTRIEDNAFRGTIAPVDLSLSLELEYVGRGALMISGDLTCTAIDIPAGCVIEKNSFAGIKASLVTLGDGCIVKTNAFNNCKELDTIIIGDNCIFDGSEGANGPEGIFAGSGIRSVYIPKSLTLGRASFLGCESLERVLFEDGRADISQECFRGCINLINLKLPDGLKTIQMYAFADCEKLDISGIPVNNTTEDVMSWSYLAFIGTPSVKEYKLFDGDLEGTISFLRLTLVIDGEPTVCSFMVGISGVENSMLLEEPHSFVYVMPEDLAGIYDEIMSEKYPQFSFPNGLYRTYDGAIYDSVGFTLIKIPYNQTNLNIAENVTAIAPSACQNTSLTFVHVPSSVVEIGDCAFMGCTDLISIEFEEGLKYIGDYAFSFTALTEVTLPSSVEHVGSYAFSIDNLSIVVPCDSELCYVGSFGLKVGEGGSIYVPSTLTEVGDLPFGYRMAEIYLGSNPSVFPSSLLRSNSMQSYQNGKWDYSHPYDVTFYLNLGTDISGIRFEQLLGSEGGHFGGYYVSTINGPLLVDQKIETLIGVVYLYTDLGQIDRIDNSNDGDGCIITMEIDGSWTRYDVVCVIDKGVLSIIDSDSPYDIRLRLTGDVDGAVITVNERVVSDTVSIEFDSRGGTHCASMTIGVGRTISEECYPSPVRNCSEFMGWVDLNGIEIKPYTPIYEDTVLYAVWSDANPRIVFDNKSHVIVDANGVNINSGYRASLDDMITLKWVAKEGYTFNHWLIKSLDESMEI